MASHSQKNEILGQIKTVIALTDRAFSSDDVDCTRLLVDLRQARRSLATIEDSMESENFEAINSTLGALIDQVEARRGTNSADQGFQSPRVSNGRRGRPSVVIEPGQLKMLYDLNYTAPQMAAQFGCSKQLIYKKLHDVGMKLRERYVDITDDMLDETVSELQEKFPNTGSVMMMGYVQTELGQVQRERVRASARRIDPVQVEGRLAKTIKRRRYAVPMSNSLWHIDGHMKLIRWGISTHGGIDGYSRLIPFLHADTDNKASTVLKHFVRGCSLYGVPSRVRTDHGRENTMIALFITLLNGEDRHSHMAGKSVHNQRIERLWKDVYTQVVSKYHSLFYSMEENGTLDMDNPYHLLALHIVYLPKLNEEMELFRQGWNSHKLSSENNRTPEQLWLNGILCNINSNAIPVSNVLDMSLPEHFDREIRRYGLDPANFREESEESVGGLISNEDKEELLQQLLPNMSQEERYNKCLEFFSRLGH